jgi:hypothetical protein
VVDPLVSANFALGSLVGYGFKFSNWGFLHSKVAKVASLDYGESGYFSLVGNFL